MRVPAFIKASLILPSLFTVLYSASPVSYDIVYVRAPRAGDNTYIRFPDVFSPTAMPPGSDLMLLHPDGSEETLFAAGKGAVLDPVLSFDAKWVFFAYIPDNTTATGINYQRGLSTSGADIYKINLASRSVVRLTNQEWSPPTGSIHWSSNPLSASAPNSVYLGYGIFNLGPCPLPNGKLMFVSSRDSYMPNKNYTSPNLRLYIMDDAGANVEPIGHINIGSALHPNVLMDGRVIFSSFETQGSRDSRDWSLWAIWPDGRHWEPLWSSMSEGTAFHFQTQLSDGRVAVTWYYNLNDNGFGTIMALDPRKPAGAIPFGSPNQNDASNPLIRVGLWGPNTGSPLAPRFFNFPFSPPGLVNLTAFTHGEDNASSYAQDGSWAGKATHPAAAPNNDLLMAWTPGPANNLNRPTTIPVYDAGIYLLKRGQPLDDYHNLVKIKNDPNYNELQPRPVVPYSAIYGIPQPAAIPFLPNDGGLSALLPAGTPFGLIGTSSFYNRNTTPGFGDAFYNGLDPFNTASNSSSSNWFNQGADDGVYTNDDIYAVRILAMEGVAHRSYPSGDDPGFINFSSRERLRILGEIPLRKSNGGTPVLDAQGNPDTSFLARIPADTPFTFQTLDKNGMVLNMAQTWHTLRPGEVRTDCGGCHAHNRTPLAFAGTAAAQAGYSVQDLTTTTPLLSKDGAGNTIVKNTAKLIADVEYYKDIKPILQRSCAQCHSGAGAAAGLVLDDSVLVNGYDNTYNRLANDANANWGYKPVISSKTWRQTNASRYIRTFQSRRSLLAWKVFGQRLDGWLNSSHPTEAVAGDAATLPANADANKADIDFTGTIMPPANSGVPALSDDEKMTIARWIDLGAPITAQGDATYAGYFADELKPTLTVSSPRAGPSTQALNAIRIGMFDAYSGINAKSLSVTANFPVNGLAAGAELAAGFAQSDSIWQLALSTPVSNLAAGRLVVKVKDNAGNLSIIDRTFSIAGVTPPPPTVSLTSPATGATVSGAVIVGAQAQSSIGIATVQFLLDGASLSAAVTGPGPAYSVSWATGAAPNGSHTLSVSATDTQGASTTSATVSVTVSNAAATGSSASYLRTDTGTLGNWTGVYGADGSVIPLDSTHPPAYASVNVNSALLWNWAPNGSADPRALYKYGSTTARIASTYYNLPGFSMDINLSDAQPHLVSFYLQDWDSGGRAQTITIKDAATNAVLDSRAVSAFVSGRYISWKMQGHLLAQVDWQAGYNAVVSGIFFDPLTTAVSSNAATFVRTDSTTVGNWQGAYGADGSLIPLDSTHLPAYANVNFNSAFLWNWTPGGTANPNALLKYGTTGTRIASTYYNQPGFTIDVNLTDNKMHQMALYLDDWDSGGRAQTINLRDGANGAILDSRAVSNFAVAPRYLVWKIQGHILVDVAWQAGYNALVNGVFFDMP